MPEIRMKLQVLYTTPGPNETGNIMWVEVKCDEVGNWTLLRHRWASERYWGSHGMGSIPASMLSPDVRGHSRATWQNVAADAIRQYLRWEAEHDRQAADSPVVLDEQRQPGG